ncbi:anti-CBASS protein Acb1 family protein [Fibrobacter sp. UWH4]|uniref:anti-CBASS protein Acb1 family protein n=1 Tax=Fibrobacter sp. UWH4 TaxID=1896210 RepID=UPI0009101EA5|nr:anti-CBASS Acb1 family protein [Fibrobacter sp. UWH4]SHL03616.1 phage-related protein, HI1409 family [Fibrobacter sp. UWH4]
MAKKTTTMMDGSYENLVTGLGKAGMDKSANIRAKHYIPANLTELASMKVQDGIASFIVDGVPEAALMKDISVTNDTEGEVLRDATRLGFFRAVKRAGSEMRLTGGSVVVTEYEGDNSETISEEPSAGAKVKGYRVYSAGRVNLRKEDFDGEEPRIFRCNKIDGTDVEIHASRCTVFHGVELPDVLNGHSLRESYFGVSALYPIEQALKELAAVSGAIVNMAQETGTLLMKMGGLNLMMSKPDCGVADIHKMMSLVKLCMNSLRAAFAGKDDGFEILSHNFAGLSEIWQKCMNIVAAKSRIPVSILFGQSATGLAQTNEGDTKAWCQTVDAWRADYLYRPMCRLIEDFSRRNLNKDYSEFEWGAVDEMTLKQTLEARKLQAETLNIYYNMGTLYPDEVRKNVFENGHSWEVSVESK